MSHYEIVSGQEWNTIECNCPWEKVKLPASEEFRRSDKNYTLSGTIKKHKKYNGMWKSSNYKLDVLIIPQKTTFFMPHSLPLINYALIQHFVKKHYLFFPQTKFGKPRKDKKKDILRFLNKLGFRKHFDIQTPTIFKRVTFEPMSEFVARDYFNEAFKEKKKKIENITELMLIHTPVLYYSPYMTDREQLDHLYTLIDKFSEMKKDDKMQQKYEEFDQIISEIRLTCAGGQKDSLDYISQYCRDYLKMDLSFKIYNYKPVDKLNVIAKNGLYLLRKFNMIPFMSHCVYYDKLIFLKQTKKRTFIDIGEWIGKKNKYLVEDVKKTYIKIKDGVCSVSVNGDQSFESKNIMKETEHKTNNFRILYLIQRQYFKNDCVTVNLPSLISVKGTMRVKCLCAFRIYQ